MPQRSPIPTPADLVQRLISIAEVESVEDLRREIVHVRTLQRWQQKGWPRDAKNVLDLLAKAGLLAQGEAAADESESPYPVLQRLVTSVLELEKSHAEALGDLADVRSRLERAEAALVPRRAARGATKKAARR